MAVACDKCQGSGLEDRENKEELAKTNPILVNHKQLCTKCAGSGVLNPENTRLAAKEAARQASGND